MRSGTKGKTISAIQPTIFRVGEKELVALGRSRQKSIWEAKSSDNGQTWSELRLTSLPNPGSGIDGVTLADGTHLLVYNHTTFSRSPLNVAVMREGGKWKAAAQLENSSTLGLEEFSYPAVIQTKDGRVHISYTWNRRRIKHVEIDPAKLEPKDFTDAGAWPKR